MGKRTKVLVYDLSNEALLAAATAISGCMAAEVMTTNSLCGALELAQKERPEVALVAEGIATNNGVSVKQLIEEVSPETTVVIVAEGVQLELSRAVATE